MEKIVYLKKDGQTKAYRVPEERIKEWKDKCSCPCASCDNAYTNKCLKVADETYRRIDKYDFITTGFQVCADDKTIEEFYIVKCNNYKLDRPRKVAKTAEQMRELRLLKESLKIAYFDAMDIDEADQTQVDLWRRAKYRLLMPEELNLVNSENAKGRNK